MMLFFVAVLAVPLAGAEVLVVTTNADSGAGSLRDAIKRANSTSEPDEIVFATDYSIVLKSPLPYVTSVITIKGNGWDRSVIDGTAFAADGAGDSMLRVAPTGRLVVDSVMLRDGSSGSVANDGEFFFRNSVAERTQLKYGGAGAFFFDSPAQSVGGAEAFATIRVTRFDGTDGAVSVTYGTSDGTAVAGVDYVATTGSLDWPDGQGGTKTFQVPIIDNPERIVSATVNVALSDPTGGAVLGSPSSMLLTIVEDGSGVGIEYIGDGFFVDEDGGSATVTVTRGSGSSGQVSVDYSTEDLSAVAGSDYSSVSGTLVWSDGETADKTFTVPITNDGTAERSKLVRLTLTNPSGTVLGDLDTAVVVITDDDGSTTCSAGGDNLCLLDNRFKIETEWRDQRTGNHDYGTAIEASNKSGFVWFFNQSNIELIVKMLDGRSLTGAYWLFYGALSDVEYWIIATDTDNGDVVLYRNVPGDICGLGDTQAFPEGKMASARVGSVMPMSEEVFDVETRVTSKTAAKVGTCVSDAETLCLLDNRFEVKVDWLNQRNGETGVGTVVPGTDNTGSFWFFNSENLELVVKVLNGVPINNKYWVFYGALSDVVYTIEVTDTETSNVQVYVNPAGEICGVGDTSAFDPE